MNLNGDNALFLLLLHGFWQVHRRHAFLHNSFEPFKIKILSILVYFLVNGFLATGHKTML